MGKPQLPSSRPTERATRALLVALLMLTACGRPVVDVPRKAGDGGDFCITQADCESGLGCHDRRCCQKTTCGAECKALLGQDGTAFAEATRHSPDDRTAFERACTTMCCAGASMDEVRRAFTSGVAHREP